MLKVGKEIHLNGYPDKYGTIIGANKWGWIVKWSDGKETRNFSETLCDCEDRSCSVSD